MMYFLAPTLAIQISVAAQIKKYSTLSKLYENDRRLECLVNSFLKAMINNKIICASENFASQVKILKKCNYSYT